jgi:hypothetical protein
MEKVNKWIENKVIEMTIGIILLIISILSVTFGTIFVSDAYKKFKNKTTGGISSSETEYKGAFPFIILYVINVFIKIRAKLFHIEFKYLIPNLLENAKKQ